MKSTDNVVTTTIPCLFDSIEKNRNKIIENMSTIVKLRESLKNFKKDDKNVDFFEFLKINDEKDLLKKKIAMLEMDINTFEHVNEIEIPKHITKLLADSVVTKIIQQRVCKVRHRLHRRILIGAAASIATATTIFIIRRRYFISIKKIYL